MQIQQLEKDISKDNNSKNTNKSNINKNLDISKNINKINNPPKQEKNKENSKKINIEIMIPKELTAYVSVTILKNFATEENTKLKKDKKIIKKESKGNKKKILNIKDLSQSIGIKIKEELKDDNDKEELNDEGNTKMNQS